ncbi:transketolase [Haloechinothrix salitolerans]
MRSNKTNVRGDHAMTTMTTDLDTLTDVARQLRVDSVRASGAAGSGHPTSSLSAADLAVVLAARHFRYDFAAPDNPNNDHLIFSKGHASPLLYALYKAVGAIDDDELLTFRKAGSRLEGHPAPVLPWVDVATGSLGQGLPIAVGLALCGKRLDRLGYRVWVLCGDGEMAEGSMWEAFEHAAHENLDNLTAIIDVNRLGQTGETMHGWDVEAYAARARACGWHAITVDGHDMRAIDDAYRAATTSGRPTVIVARTVKGKGVAEVENATGKHGKPLPDTDAAVAELGGYRDVRISAERPDVDAAPHVFATEEAELPTWRVGDEVATREAYGEALAALGRRRGDIVALDGEVSNSTKSELFAKAVPERYLEMYIAEQQMFATAIALQVRGWRPFVSTFAAFTARAFDFTRMAAISRANFCVTGSHAGVAIGEDGPSQMGLEDIAAFRAVHGSTVIYPCDANQTAALLARLIDRDGIRYLRTNRGKTPVIYPADEEFRIGHARVLRASDADDVTIVAAGVTVHEALAAAERLTEDGIAARVIDCYSVKPIDVETLTAAAGAAGGRVLTVEDHFPEGGLGEAVLTALAGVDAHVRQLAVREMPGSATPEEQLRFQGIDAAGIATAARDLVATR